MGRSLLVPPIYEALGGISLETLVKLTSNMDLDVAERRLAVHDLINSDEAFIIATSFSILPVTSVDGIPLRDPREVYPELLRAWMALVEFDFLPRPANAPV